MPRIESLFIGCPARSLVTIPTELSVQRQLKCYVLIMCTFVRSAEYLPIRRADGSEALDVISSSLLAPPLCVGMYVLPPCYCKDYKASEADSRSLPRLLTSSLSLGAMLTETAALVSCTRTAKDGRGTQFFPQCTDI
jgi:hypothetical protein